MSEPVSARSCPYCGIVFSIDGVEAYNSPVLFESARSRFVSTRDPNPSRESVQREPSFTFTCHLCPSCSGKIIWLTTVEYEEHPTQNYLNTRVTETVLLYPKMPQPVLPPDTPTDLADEYRQAVQILEISPKASAALARRSLQNLIRSQEQINRPSLQAEIQGLIALGKLPAYLAKELDAIRIIGNFAAHPLKDSASGTVIDVER